MTERTKKYPGIEGFSICRCGNNNRGLGIAILQSCIEGCLVRPFERMPFIKTLLIEERLPNILEALEQALAGEITNVDLKVKIRHKFKADINAASERLFKLGGSDLELNPFALMLISRRLNIEINIYISSDRCFLPPINNAIYMNPMVVYIFYLKEKHFYRMKQLDNPYEACAEPIDLPRDETTEILFEIASLTYTITDRTILNKEFLNECLEKLEKYQETDLYKALKFEYCLE